MLLIGTWRVFGFNISYSHNPLVSVLLEGIRDSQVSLQHSQ
jgi:hypothetical protein